jgi:hypothetical protein
MEDNHKTLSLKQSGYERLRTLSCHIKKRESISLAFRLKFFMGFLSSLEQHKPWLFGLTTNKTQAQKSALRSSVWYILLLDNEFSNNS